MLKKLNPDTVHKPLSPYSHAVEGDGAMRWMHVSGQVGIAPDGKLAPDPEGQIEQAFRNLLAVLEGAGMGPQDLVKITTFLTRREDLPTLRAARTRALAGAEPASTLLFVAGLAHPDMIVEVEAVAARAARARPAARGGGRSAISLKPGAKSSGRRAPAKRAGARASQDKPPKP